MRYFAHVLRQTRHPAGGKEYDVWRSMVMLEDDDGKITFVGLTPVPTTERAAALDYAVMLASRHAATGHRPWGVIDGDPVDVVPRLMRRRQVAVPEVTA